MQQSHPHVGRAEEPSGCFHQALYQAAARSEVRRSISRGTDAIVEAFDVRSRSGNTTFLSQNIGPPSKFITTLEADVLEPCVPRLLHFLWVTSVVPSEVLQRVAVVAADNRDEFETMIWTDHPLPTHQGLPPPYVRLRNVTELQPALNAKWIKWFDNPGIKSDLWRLEVIFRVGGIYLDVSTHTLHPQTAMTAPGPSNRPTALRFVALLGL